MRVAQKSSKSYKFAEVTAMGMKLLNKLIALLFQTLVVTTDVGEFVDLSRTITYHDYEIGTSMNRILSIWTRTLKLVEQLHSEIKHLVFSDLLIMLMEILNLSALVNIYWPDTDRIPVESNGITVHLIDGEAKIYIPEEIYETL